MLLKPDLGPDASSFPALPEIKSDAVRLQVLTHRSFFARPTHIFEDHPDDPSPDNEKFEHLGDIVIGLVVTELLLETLPGLRVGPSTKIRALIVGNATLADISLRYKLPDRLRLHAAQAITLRASTNIQADIFESYVGGLYTDQGLLLVKKWLNPLFMPYMMAAYHLVRAQHGLPAISSESSPSPSDNSPPSSSSSSSSLSSTACKNARTQPLELPPSYIPLMTTIGHLALFNQKIQKANREVEWIYSEEAAYLGAEGLNNTTPVWGVRVMVDGKFYGSGRGNTKKAARNEAAKEGLRKMDIFV